MNICFQSMKPFQVVLAGIMLSASSLSFAQAPVPSTIEGAEQYTLTATKTKNSYRVDIYRVNSTIAKLPENYKLPA